MGSFCDGSIIFFSIRLFSNRPSNHNNTQEEKFSLLQAVFSERRRGEQDLGQSDSKEKKNMDIFKACRSTGSPGMKVCCFKAILPLLYYSQYSATRTDSTHRYSFTSQLYFTQEKLENFEKGLSYTYNVSRICIVYACSIAG